MRNFTEIEFCRAEGYNAGLNGNIKSKDCPHDHIEQVGAWTQGFRIGRGVLNAMEEMEILLSDDSGNSCAALGINFPMPYILGNTNIPLGCTRSDDWQQE